MTSTGCPSPTAALEALALPERVLKRTIRAQRLR
jgi:hypothetical protein